MPLLNSLATTGGIVGSVLVADNAWWWLLLAPSCLLGVVVLVWGVKHEDRHSVLNARIRSLEGELATARIPTMIAVVTSALSEEWQALLETELASLLLAKNFHPVVLAARRNYSVQEQRSNLRLVERSRGKFLGAVVIPVEPEGREEEFREFCATFGKPVVFLDNQPFSSPDSCPANAVFVGVSSEAGGALAAQAVLSSFRDHPPSEILVIASNTQVQRQRVFQANIAKSWPQCHVRVDESGMFDEDAAYEAALLHLRSAAEIGVPLDAVFCTSDSMMVGCMRACERMSGEEGFVQPRLFSYDGTPPLQKLARDPTSYVARVVIQDPHAIAVGAVDRLERLLALEDASGSEWIRPQLFPSLETCPGGHRAMQHRPISG